jgi:hypothetical protein
MYIYSRNNYINKELMSLCLPWEVGGILTARLSRPITLHIFSSNDAENKPYYPKKIDFNSFSELQNVEIGIHEKTSLFSVQESFFFIELFPKTNFT